MSTPIPSHQSSGGLIQSRDDRVLSRQLAHLDRSRVVGMARLEVAAQIEAARVHAVGYVGQQAMQAVALVSQLEGQLGQICPLAVSRLQGIADITALSIAQVVNDAHRRLS
jgi:hypothetical protein